MTHTPTLLAHGIPGTTSLPIPIGLFIVAGATIVVVSFALLAGLWKQPRWTHVALTPVRAQWLGGRVATGVGQALVLALFALGVVAALIGTTEPGDNLAPLLVLVVWWIGLVPLALLGGAIWTRINPWRTLTAVGQVPDTGAHLSRLGVWPAYAVIALFAWLELVYFVSSHPRVLGVLMVGYSVLMCGVALVWGNRLAFGQFEGFSVYSSLLARLSIWGRTEDGRLARRLPFVGAMDVPALPGMCAFVTLLIGSVSYDGLTQSGWWTRRVSVATARLTDLGMGPEIGRLVFGTFGLIVLVLCAWGAFELAARAAGRLGSFPARPGGPRVAEQFAGTLLPIAAGYVIAHYFTLFVLQAPSVVRLLSDPFGFGWNLFGTATLEWKPWMPSANLVWYVQVGAIVVGHVIALVLAHDRAVALAPSSRAAIRSQIPMLALMVLYTVGGLYFLSEGLS